MKNGGKRPGAGRKPGVKNKKTLEKEAIAAAFNQRVMQHADNLFNAQLKLAVGSQKVFRVDVSKKGDVKHTLVTDVGEIKDLLDEHQGADGTVDGTYYYFQTVAPDNRALDSLLNRTLGRPKETRELQGEIGIRLVDDSE